MRNRLFAVLIVTLAATTLWLVMSPGPRPAAEPVRVRASSLAAAPASIPSVERKNLPVAPDAVAAASPWQTSAPSFSPPSRPRALAAREELPVAPEMEGAPDLSPVTVLENMRSVFNQYRARFGGNPVGSNPEITASLNGKNPRAVVFVNPEDGLRINDRGQLIDNWGTPFFFHQISRTEMEIRSAGPDRRMWTADDLVVK